MDNERFIEEEKIKKAALFGEETKVAPKENTKSNDAPLGRQRKSIPDTKISSPVPAVNPWSAKPKPPPEISLATRIAFNNFK